MTPQQSVDPQSKVTSDESSIQQKQKMKTTLQRKHSGQSAITKAFSKQWGHNRDGVLTPTPRVRLVQNLVSQSSEFVMEEHVQLSIGLQTQERHLFLFNDVLIITKSKTSSTLKLKVSVRLCEMWLASCMDEVAERKLTSNNSFVIGWPVTSYVVTFSSSEIKEKWLSALQWQISKSKEEKFPCTVSMKIVLMDIGKSAMVAVDVNNKDDAEKVIKIISQQLGLPGQATDYRLWAVSGKEEAPYPLIGHELPYSIILHSLRETTGQGSAIFNNLLTVDGRLYLDQLLRDTPGPRFILRLKAARGAHGGKVNSSERQIKRKKSLIDWALRRGHVSLSGGLSGSSTSPPKLFGLSLSSICHHGNLPRPIMDLLYLLYHEGATTTGIFRRSANAKTCRELKEKLNSGANIQLEVKSVFVAAAVITDFLRNLPGSVLCSALYDQWMEAMEVEHKIGMVQSLLKQLPAENVALLRYLFALLYHIQQHSQKNQMNAFNLALCIAPNMLWPPAAIGPEEESQSTKKVAALIQLIIENTPTIFGEDVESIFNEPTCGPGTLEDVRVESDQQSYPLCDWDSERQSLLLPLRQLDLKEQKEIFDFMDEADTLKRIHVSEDSAYSCGDIKVMSSYSSSSICSLMGTQSLSSARDRCSSEPSVSLGSPQPHGQLHTPVARQSSCDAAMMCGQHSEHTHKHATKGPKGDSSPRVVGNRYTFWRSPQVSSRFWHPAQRSVSSYRSSFSSLSSTATSPSGSSLSSIDSAFSFCSDSLSSCPNEVKSLPFLFGSSARLRPLTPDSPKKFPKDWSMAMAQAPENLKWYHEYDEGEEDRSVHDMQQRCHPVFTQNSEEPQPLSQSMSMNKTQQCHQNADIQLVDRQRSETRDQTQQNQQDGVSETSESIGQVQKTTISHIQLEEVKVKRTKITFYTASNTKLVNKHSDQLVGDCEVSLAADTEGEHLRNVELLKKTVKVHIPQTVFYGQNSPLVLKSVSSKQAGNACEKGTKVKTNFHSGNMDPSQMDGSNLPPQPSSKKHGKSSSSISHTIRKKLPETVRNTVREYFGSTDSKSSTDSKAVAKELLLTKAMAK